MAFECFWCSMLRTTFDDTPTLMWSYAIMTGYYLIDILGIEILGAAGATSTGYLGWWGLGGRAKSERSASFQSFNRRRVNAGFFPRWQNTLDQGAGQLVKPRNSILETCRGKSAGHFYERSEENIQKAGTELLLFGPKDCWMQSHSWFQASEEKARRWRAWAFCSASS